MKMKEFGPQGGPWRPPWIRQCLLSSKFDIGYLTKGNYTLNFRFCCSIYLRGITRRVFISDFTLLEPSHFEFWLIERMMKKDLF